MRAPKTRDALARVGVGFALLLFLTPSVITFIPGTEAAGWFATAGFAALIGLLSPNWRVRVAGIAVAAACAWFAWEGHLRGVEYEAYLRARGVNNP